MKNEDVAHFEDCLGLKYDPKTKMTYKALIRYKGEEEVKEWSETGFTFETGFVEGPGVREKLGILAFATLDTAQKCADFVANKVVPFGYKVEITTTQWDGAYKRVKPDGSELPEYQILITSESGRYGMMNAGLVANQIIRSGPEFAAEVLKSQVY